MGKFKGQTAMEYLMTYGWAILIVIIVAAALFALGVFNPATYTQQTATGFSGFNVPTGGFQLSSAGTLTIQLTSGAGATVQITDAWTNVGTTHLRNTTVPSLVTFSPGQTTTLKFAGLGPMSSGTAYSANVNITYTNTETGLSFVTTGTLTGSVS